MNENDAKVERIARLMHETSSQWRRANEHTSNGNWKALPSYARTEYRHVARVVIDALNQADAPSFVEGQS